ncbi:hypothetical protein P7H50_04950 [Enterococcus durans]|nr:hypothetical protein [Enterococcus durans]MDT2836238.1 hypothetical protein [Enterococcus durans]
MAHFVIKYRGEAIKAVCYENKLRKPSKPIKENQAWMKEIKK